MNILIINPNTTASMTEKMEASAHAVAANGTTITAVQPECGPASIEGFYDEAFAVPGLIAEIAKNPAADAIIIACFDDTGLDAARCFSTVPVIGIGEAAYHAASFVANRFGVVTTLTRSVAALQHNLNRYGLASRCAGVRAADIPVLELENPESNAFQRISQEIQRSIDSDGADAIVLGCAGMTDLAAALQAEHGVPVIDGVVSAVKFAEALVGLGLKTSKHGAYAAPAHKPYLGILSQFEPPNTHTNEPISND